MTDLEYNPTDTWPADVNGYVAFKWEKPFFDAFLDRYGTVSQAAEAAGVTESVVEQRVKDSPMFARGLADCRAHLKDTFRHEAVRRALEPERIPIVYRGRIIGHQERYDNRHLEWMLERLMPEEFHLPSRVESGNDGETVFKLELTPAKSRKDQDEQPPD